MRSKIKPSATKFSVGQRFLFISLSCAISLGASVVLSGGKGAEQKVVQYSGQGWQQDLPDLNVGRYAHACSSYYDSSGRLVSGRE